MSRMFQAGGIGSPRSRHTIEASGIPGLTQGVVPMGSFVVKDDTDEFNQTPVLTGSLTAEDEADFGTRVVRWLQVQCSVLPRLGIVDNNFTPSEYEDIVLKRGQLDILRGSAGATDVLATFSLVPASASILFAKGAVEQPIALAQGDWQSLKFRMRWNALPATQSGSDQEFTVSCDVLVWFDAPTVDEMHLIEQMRSCEDVRPEQMLPRIRPPRVERPLRTGRRFMGAVER